MTTEQRNIIAKSKVLFTGLKPEENFSLDIYLSEHHSVLNGPFPSLTKNLIIFVRRYPEHGYSRGYSDFNYSAIQINPFGNCQMSSIGWVNYMLKLPGKNYQVITSLFKAAVYCCSKIICMDIRKDLLPMFEKYFSPAYYISKIDYVSTNGSHMVHILYQKEGFLCPNPEKNETEKQQVKPLPTTL